MADKWGTKDLSRRQQMFVEHYIMGLPASAAAERAGYSHPGSQCTRLLANVRIAEAIQQGMQERSKRVQIDADYVLRQAVKLHEKCMSEDSFNATAAARSLELVGRHVGVQAFRDQVGVGNPDGTPLTLDVGRLSDTALAEVWAAMSERQDAIDPLH